MQGVETFRPTDERRGDLAAGQGMTEEGSADAAPPRVGVSSSDEVMTVRVDDMRFVMGMAACDGAAAGSDKNPVIEAAMERLRTVAIEGTVRSAPIAGSDIPKIAAILNEARNMIAADDATIVARTHWLGKDGIAPKDPATKRLMLFRGNRQALVDALEDAIRPVRVAAGED